MKTATRTVTVTAFLLAVCAAAPRAEAQPRDRRPARVAQDDDDAIEAKRAKVRQRIRAMRAWKLTEALDLDDTTAEKLFPIINGYDEKLEAVTRRHRRLRRQLRQAVDAGDAKRIDRLIDDIVAQQRRLWELQEDRFRAVRKVLTPAQSAKVMVVLPEIDRAIQRHIRRAVRGRGRGGRGGAVKDPFR